MDRRIFIKTATVATAAMAILPSACLSESQRKSGLALWSVRDDMRENPLATLEKIASMGYNYIEAADYREGKFYGMEPSDFKSAVEERGLGFLSSHNGINPENVDEIVGSASEAGVKYLVLPSLPRKWSESLDGFKEAAAFLNVAGEKCKAQGIQVAFHNHTVEFMPIDGVIPFDILMENTDPGLVTFELDLAWITGGGQKAEDYLKKYPGRYELWHIKDLTDEGQDATLGEGIIDFKPIFDLEKLSGMKHFFIEQDNCRTHTPLESVQISRSYLFENIL